MRPQRRNQVWSYDYIEAQTHDGCNVRLMTLIDEFALEYSLITPEELEYGVHICPYPVSGEPLFVTPTMATCTKRISG
jgi:hypothetical protein